METKYRVKLSIADCDFTVTSEESEQYVLEVADKLNSAIRSLMNSAPNMSTTLATILVALDYCDKSEKEKQAADNLRGQIKNCLDETAELREKLQNSINREHDLEQNLKALKTMNGLKALEEQRKTDGK